MAGRSKRKDHSPLHQDREADRPDAPKGNESHTVKGEKQLSKPPQGKQSLKQLMKQNAGVSNIEITEGNIKAFEGTAKKYGIDFALKKDATESPPRYLVFFKGRDADVLTAAFKEFSAKKLTQEKKPSIRKLLSTLKEAAQGRNAERAKVKNKDREVSL
ncbi:PcfB family protein [Collinsella aerofaciens]|uniref:PcfB family protein n=1 Tax=Collinsella aerofaciens TaxID=74426 RepID=UPI003D31EE8A